MSSYYDSGFHPAGPPKTTSSPNLFRGSKSPYSHTKNSPLPKPLFYGSNSNNDTRKNLNNSPMSPASPTKSKRKGDRFITSSSGIDLSVAQFAMLKTETQGKDHSPALDLYKRSIAVTILGSETAADLVAGSEAEAQAVERQEVEVVRSPMNVSSSSLLTSSPKSPSKLLSCAPRTTSSNSFHVLHANSQSPRRKSTIRIIPTQPERVLDAPNMIDDYYLNLLDWSALNFVGVALGNSVYLWNAATGETTTLMSVTGAGNYISSLSFSGAGQYLAIGTADCKLQIYDVSTRQKVRSIHGHNSRVCSLSWCEQLLSSGSKESSIMTHDVRVPQEMVAAFEGHSHEVCGLKWSPDGSQLASGSNDNLLQIWTLHSMKPIHTFAQHSAAVKAINWCPWQRNLLASGGGTADKTIKFWNTSVGNCINTIDTKSQVCSVMWSKHVKELISSHGYSLNQLTIWKYPSLVKQAELHGHTMRVLHTAMSPDGTTVVSAAADETLRFWKVFDIERATSRMPKSYSEANLRAKMHR